MSNLNQVKRPTDTPRGNFTVGVTVKPTVPARRAIIGYIIGHCIQRRHAKEPKRPMRAGLH
jgi:hypothetical protein